MEHRKLRMALSRAWAALKQLEADRLQEAMAEPERDIFGEPLKTDEVRPARKVNLRPLFDAWSPFEDAVLRRLDRWEQDLWPAVRAWDQGRPIGEQIQRIALKLDVDRRNLERELLSVRATARGVGQLRAPMLSLFSAIEMSDRAESAVLPALKTGDRVLADHAERGRTPADVVRALRSKIPSQESEPDVNPEPVNERSPLSKFMGWLGGGR